MPIRAVTFDFWQTLYADNGPIEQERVRVRVRLIAALLSERGIEFEHDSILLGLADARVHMDRVWRMEHRTLAPEKQALAVARRVGLTSPDGLLRDLGHAMQTAAIAVPADHVPHAMDTLRAVAERYRVALICDTGFSPGWVLRGMMERDGILDYFQHLTFSDELGSSKPSLANFQSTLNALGVEPREAAHVGDLIETDIIGAKNAGMKAVLYWGDGRDYTATAPADVVIRDHRELLTALAEVS